MQIDVQEREEENKHAMLKAAQRKASGPDSIPVELISSGGEVTLNALHKMCTEVWQSESWREEWMQSVFIPLSKKADLYHCSNYSTNTLVSHASKILPRVMLER